LRELGVELSAPTLPKQALITEPYKGLSAFTDKDAAIFFGREKYIEELVNKLANQQRFIAVLGASGSGKSSLVKAGLIVKLQQAQVQGKTWRIVQMRPTREPLYELQNRWRDVFPQKLKIENAEVLHQSIMQLVEHDALLLVIDQFEEVFTECQNEDKRLEFFRVLLGALQCENALHVVITLRADFLGKCIERDNAGLARCVSEFGVFVLPLSASELHEVIIAPLAQTGKTIESQLVDILIDEASREKGCLPLLQYALEQLWKNARTLDAKILTVAQYQTLCKNTQAGSGLRGLLNERADAFYQSLSAAQKPLMQWLFLELVQLGEGIEDTRKTLKQVHLFNKHPEQRANIASLLEELTTEQRLLMCDAIQENGQSLETVTVAHEALIRDWGQLREWVNQYRDLKRWREHLEADLQQWKVTKARDRLLQGGKLADAEEKLATYRDSLLIDEEVRGFIKESQVYRREELARKQKQARNFINLSAAFVLVAVIFSVFSVWQWQKSEMNYVLAEQKDTEAKANLKRSEENLIQSKINQSRMLAGFAEIALKEDKPSLAMRLALEALPKYSETYPERPFVSVAYDWLSRSINRQFQGIFEHEDSVKTAVFSPDGTKLLTASGKQVLVWDMKTGQLLLTLSGHTYWVKSAAYSPDGTQIVTASADKAARVWDAKTGQMIFALSGHEDWVLSAAYSPDGTRIITASQDKTARVWDAKTGQIIFTLSGHKDYVRSAVYSPNGLQIVTASGGWGGASKDNTARIWDAQTGLVIRILRGHEDILISATYSSDGTRIVTSSRDKNVYVWDAQTGQTIFTISGKHKNTVNSAYYNLNGTRIITASLDTAYVWDAQTGQIIFILRGHKNLVKSASYSPNGMWIVTASEDSTVRIWDALTGQAIRTLRGHKNLIWSAAYSPDNSQIVTASEDSTVRIWDALTGQVIHTLEHDREVLSAAYSPNGMRIITASWDKTARVWDVQTGQLILTLDHRHWVNAETFSLEHLDMVNSATFSPDSRQIVTASDNETARVWDAQTGRIIFTLKEHKDWVWSAAYSPDGMRIVTASGDKTARVWDVQTGKAICVLEGHQNKLRSASYSPDSTRIVTASDDNSARVWDALTGQDILTLKGHRSSVRSAVYSPDGTRIVTASGDFNDSEDNTVRLWNAQTGEQLTTLCHEARKVNSARFSPDGLNIVTASDDDTARIWLSFPSISAMVAHAKKMLPPRISDDKGDEGIENFRLTCEERRRFFLEELERCKGK
jgi:WD40 repeat protein/energy-coupling factor transporter ATP-binding protein EcfA2